MTMRRSARCYLIGICSGLLLAGCSTETVVTLQDGSQFITRDMPRTETADGFYEFVDISGRTVRVRADQVATVQKED